MGLSFSCLVVLVWRASTLWIIENIQHNSFILKIVLLVEFRSYKEFSICGPLLMSFSKSQFNVWKVLCSEMSLWQVMLLRNKHRRCSFKLIRKNTYVFVIYQKSMNWEIIKPFESPIMRIQVNFPFTLMKSFWKIFICRWALRNIFDQRKVYQNFLSIFKFYEIKGSLDLIFWFSTRIW